MAESSHSWHESKQSSIIQVNASSHCSKSLMNLSVIQPQGGPQSPPSWFHAVTPRSVNQGSHYSSILIHAVIFQVKSRQLFFLWLEFQQFFIDPAEIQAVTVPSTEIRQSLFLQLKSRRSFSFGPNLPSSSSSHYSSKSRKSLFL